MDEEEALVVLVTDTCDLCGRRFAEGEEFYLLKRVARRPGGGGEVVNEVAMCVQDCGKKKVVRI